MTTYIIHRINQLGAGASSFAHFPIVHESVQTVLDLGHLDIFSHASIIKVLKKILNRFLGGMSERRV
ncbi:MAG: hypothetical protein CG439_1344 [Methylococcaceae bacterium NSP1-2]|nr:MAG: hypothetical protein CG439_1344 [Methylococcaceae bacterium NSP1-2]